MARAQLSNLPRIEANTTQSNRPNLGRIRTIIIRIIITERQRVHTHNKEYTKCIPNNGVFSSVRHHNNRSVASSTSASPRAIARGAVRVLFRFPFGVAHARTHACVHAHARRPTHACPNRANKALRRCALCACACAYIEKVN